MTMAERVDALTNLRSHGVDVSTGARSGEIARLQRRHKALVKGYGPNSVMAVHTSQLLTMIDEINEAEPQ